MSLQKHEAFKLTTLQNEFKNGDFKYFHASTSVTRKSQFNPIAMNESDKKLGELLVELKSQEIALQEEIRDGRGLPFGNISKFSTQLSDVQVLIREIEEELTHH